MQVAIIFFAVVACSLAAPRPDGVVPIVTFNEVRDDVGQFALSYSTGNGIAVAEQGALKQINDGTTNVLVRQGSYKYLAPDGQIIELSYIADENGFQPRGAHLPTPPPAPIV